MLVKPNVDKIYIYAKDPYKAKHPLLINNRERVDSKYYNDSSDMNILIFKIIMI